MLRPKARFDSDSSLEEKIFAEVEAERRYQDVRWGEQMHPSKSWISILGEEIGEVCKANNQQDAESYRAELIQVAATAIAAVEDFDKSQGEVQLGL